MPFELNSANIEKKAGVKGMADEAALPWLVTEVEKTTETVEVRWGEQGGDDVGGGFGPPRVTEQVPTLGDERAIHHRDQGLSFSYDRLDDFCVEPSKVKRLFKTATVGFFAQVAVSA